MDRNNAKLRIGGTNYMAPDGMSTFIKSLQDKLPRRGEEFNFSDQFFPDVHISSN